MKLLRMVAVPGICEHGERYGSVTTATWKRTVPEDSVANHHPWTVAFLQFWRTAPTGHFFSKRLATGWSVRGSNPGGGRDFPHPSRPAPGAHPASYTLGTGSFPGVKRPDLGVDHQPPSSAEVKERVDLLPLWIFVACSGVKFNPHSPSVACFPVLCLCNSGHWCWVGRDRSRVINPHSGLLLRYQWTLVKIPHLIASWVFV